MKELKDLIKERRKEIGKTLEQVGKEMGVSKATVQRWESGEIKDMRQGKLRALAKALETTPAYLMGWDEITASISGDGRSEIQTIFDSLTPDNQAKLLELSRLYLDAQHNNEKKK